MDEPFFGLDPVNAALLKDVMLRFEEQGKTILFSTHRNGPGGEKCDRHWPHHKGNAVLQGDLKTIKSGYGKATCRLNMKATAIPGEKPAGEALITITQLRGIKLAPGAGLTATLAHGGRHSRVEPVSS